MLDSFGKIMLLVLPCWEMRAQILDSNDHIMRDIFATQMIAPQFLSVLSRNTETPKQVCWRYLASRDGEK